MSKYLWGLLRHWAELSVKWRMDESKPLSSYAGLIWGGVIVWAQSLVILCLTLTLSSAITLMKPWLCPLVERFLPPTPELLAQTNSVVGSMGVTVKGPSCFCLLVPDPYILAIGDTALNTGHWFTALLRPGGQGPNPAGCPPQLAP